MNGYQGVEGVSIAEEYISTVNRINEKARKK